MNIKDVLGTLLQNNKYRIKITEDNTYTLDSTDNKNYDYVMNPHNFKRNHTYKTLHISLSGIKNMNIALICDFNTIEYDCAILEGDTLTILLNDYIAQIDLNTVRIIGGYPLDVFGTNLSIHRLSDGYLIHGEIEIIKLDNEFNTMWKFSGKDIFASVSGKNSFEIAKNSIKLYDFLDNYYELDFDGNTIKFKEVNK